MIEFKDVTVDDKQLIQSFTLWGKRQNCDLSFANMISWRFLFNTQFAVVDNCLVFRFHTGRHLAYMAPVARPRQLADGSFVVNEDDECPAEVIRKMREDSIAMGHPFLMLGVCRYMRDIIERRFPDMFDIKAERDYSDYIYLREKLVSLSGKKLQSKRNHVNKFKSLYPDYEYRELTADLIPQCLELVHQWRTVSKGDNGEDGNEGLTAELRSMTRAFNRWESLGLLGGTIFVGGRMVAFTYGCPVNQNTFDVCVEKADINYDGAFAAINQEFAKHIPEQYVYINREEDLGYEGLRKAKLSYRPEMLLEKNSVVEKRPLADFEDQERIFCETKDIWRTVFGDPEEFIDLYFSRVYKSEYNVSCQLDGHVAAALQTLPYPMLYNGKEADTAYISGVAVLPEYRKQHVGANLMRQAHLRLYHKGVVFATLIPAEEWLFDWYKRCGYARVAECQPAPVDPLTVSFAEFDAVQRSRDCILLHDEEGYGVIKDDIRIAGSSYMPRTETVPAMLRVVNAEKALCLYAERHAGESMTIRIDGDNHVPMNNAYYTISNGTASKTDEPCPKAVRLTIAGLAELIFKEKKVGMNLMLN